MGEVRVTLKVRGITGDFRPSGDGPTSVEALVDTGASRTVVSSRIADAAGIQRTHVGHIAGVVGHVAVDVGPAVIAADACGCAPEALFVAISDAITKAADAEMVLGHDYMQTARMRVTPHDESARCPKLPRTPRRSKTRDPGEKRTAARRK